MKSKIVIIGAGIGGIATANLLARAGYDVHVYEQHAQLGGRAGQKNSKGFHFDTGPSWYLMPGVFSHYFSLFDVDATHALVLKKLSPGYKVFYESRRPITITGKLATDARTFEAVEPGAGTALRRYVTASDTLYQLAVRHFLYTNFNHPKSFINRTILTHFPRFGRLLVQPLHRYVRRFVRTQALQQILEYPTVFLGTSPFRAPAMYSLMSALDFKEGVFYPKNGIYAIIELLVSIGKKQGVHFHTNSPVKRIITRASQATGIQLTDGTFVAADIVISNADLHFTETKLLNTAVQSYPEQYWQKKEAGISGLLLYLGVKGSLPQLEHHNLFFVDDWRENFQSIYTDRRIPKAASLYVSRTTATDPKTAPVGHEALFVLVPLPTGVTISDSVRERLAERFIDQLATSIDQPDLRSRIVFQESFGPNQFREKFNAWEGSALGMSHLLRQSAFWRTPNHSKKVSNLYYVGGNTMPGVGLPMCLISAQLVFKRIQHIQTTGPLSREELL